MEKMHHNKFTIKNPFIKNDERATNSLGFTTPTMDKIMTDFKQQGDERIQTMEKNLEEFVYSRGAGAYRETLERRRSGAQPVFTNTQNRKLTKDERGYPYLMSVFNMEPKGGTSPALPWQCDADPTANPGANAACDEWHRNNYARRHSLSGLPRGVLKDMEHDAKISSKMLEAVLNMDQSEAGYAKRLLDIVKMYKKDLKLGNRSNEFLSNPKNINDVAWQTNKQLEKIYNDHLLAVNAQDLADKKRQNQYEFNKTMNQIKNDMEEFKGFLNN